MNIKIRVNVNGSPLRRAFVEHVTGPLVHATYITDNSGRVRNGDGDEGIDSWTPNVDIRVRCQNSVARVLDGRAANIAVTQDFTGLSDGSTVNISTAARQRDHYEILNRVLTAYDVVFRQFSPFSHSSRGDFPLKRKTSLADTMNQERRIEISYPSQHPNDLLAFVEPHCLSTGYPLIHIREKSEDRRLFGSSGRRPTLIPGELAHALHFSLFSGSKRLQIETDYLGWLVNDSLNGGGGTHTIGKTSSPMVAYIEAFDWFAGKFSEYVRRTLQGETDNTAALERRTITVDERRGFYRQEMDGTPALGPKVAIRSGVVGVPDTAGLAALSPPITLGGGSDEGSVLGCIFIEYARRAGLRAAVNSYLQSAADGVLTFGQFKTWVGDNDRDNLDKLNSAQATWGL